MRKATDRDTLVQAAENQVAIYRLHEANQDTIKAKYPGDLGAGMLRAGERYLEGLKRGLRDTLDALPSADPLKSLDTWLPPVIAPIPAAAPVASDGTLDFG